jgi:hypothetical protein
MSKTQLIIGVLLIAVVHSFVNIGLPVIMLPILKPYNERVMMAYLSAAISSTVIVAVGTIFYLLLLPLSNEYTNATSELSLHNNETLAFIITKGGYFSYQLGMALWGIGGLMLCYLLYQSKLVPRLLTIWGAAGYVIFISGTICELFEINIGVMLSLPGGLFEIFLSIWLIVKGFNEVNSNALKAL